MPRSQPPFFYLGSDEEGKLNRGVRACRLNYMNSKWQGMKVIEIKPTKKFGGAWCAFEAPGVEPATFQAGGN